MGRTAGDGGGATTETPQAASVRAFLREAMREKNWRPVDVGRVIGMGDNAGGYVNGVLAGFRCLKPEALARLSDAMGVTVDFILKWPWDAGEEQELMKAKKATRAREKEKKAARKAVVVARAAKVASKTQKHPKGTWSRVPDDMKVRGNAVGRLTDDEVYSILRAIENLVKSYGNMRVVETQACLPFGAVSKLLRKTLRPTLETARRIAAVYQVHVVEIIWPQYRGRSAQDAAAQ